MIEHRSNPDISTVEGVREDKRVLIATIGEAPEVVTEVLDKLVQEQIRIDEVVVVHTDDPAVKQGRWTAIGGLDDDNTPIMSQRVWQKGLEQHPIISKKAYLKQEFKPDNPHAQVKLRYPEDSFRHSDINSTQQNSEFARHLFSVMLKEHLAGNSVYISLAGGRKTMSAYALLGAVLFGAKGVFHVLVSKDIEDKLRLQEKFHVRDVIPDLKRLRDGDFELIRIPIPELRHFLSEEVGPEEQMTKEIVNVKILIDVVNKLADEEKNNSALYPYPIFHNNTKLQELVHSVLNQEIKKALAAWKAEDRFPGPWECLFVQGREDATFLREAGDFPSQLFNVQTCMLGPAEQKLEEILNVDLVILDAPSSDEDLTEILRVLRQIRRRYPLLPIVCLTQGRRVVTSLQMTRAGATLCLARAEYYRIPLSMEALFIPLLSPDCKIRVQGVDDPSTRVSCAYSFQKQMPLEQSHGRLTLGKAVQAAAALTNSGPISKSRPCRTS